MRRKIVITGSSGFIGSHLSEFLSRFYNVIGIDRELGSKHTIYHQDINNKLPDISNVYGVIHLAAKAGVRESQSNFEQYVKDNIIGTKNILDKCVDSWRPKHIMLASSSSVNGDTSDKYKPKSLYAMSKIAMEDILKTYVNNGTINDLTMTSILRIYTVYGPNQRKGLAIRNFIDNILQDKPITLYGDGSQRRDFTYIQDLCYRIENLLDVYNEDSNLNTYHLGNGTNYSINEIIMMISRLSKKDVTIHYETMNRYDVMETLSKREPPHIYGSITPIEFGLDTQIKWTKKELKKC